MHEPLLVSACWCWAWCWAVTMVKSPPTCGLTQKPTGQLPSRGKACQLESIPCLDFTVLCNLEQVSETLKSLFSETRHDTYPAFIPGSSKYKIQHQLKR